MTVSVIIPVYKVERFIERCVRSLMEQTWKDAEFIFVDDASPDRSIEIVQRVASEYQRDFRIIRHETNRGLPSARNTGLLHAKGDYIYHCDSDDWLDRDMLRKLWEKAVEGDYDMVECDFYECDEDGNDHSHIYPQKPDHEDWIPWPYTPVHWNKIFKRCIYQNDINWPSEHLLEDYIIVTQLIYYCKSYCYIDDILYHYYLNPKGIMIRSDKREIIKGRKKLIRFAEDFLQSKGLLSRYEVRLTIMKSETMAEAWNLPRKEFLDVFPEDRLKVLTCKSIPLGRRLGHLSKLLGIHGLGKIFGLS